MIDAIESDEVEGSVPTEGESEDMETMNLLLQGNFLNPRMHVNDPKSPGKQLSPKRRTKQLKRIFSR